MAVFSSKACISATSFFASPAFRVGMSAALAAETVAGTVMRTYVDWFAPTFLLSLTGLPVASVPCGLDGRGLPVGLQVVGRPNDEETVLAVAAEIQRRHPVLLPRSVAPASSA